MATNSINRQFLPGVIQSVLGRYAHYVVQLLALAVYARLFTPEQFGVIAGIQVFIVFFQILGEVGLAPAIINKTELTPEDRDGIFTCSMIIGLAISMLFFLALPLIDDFYGRSDYTYIGLPILAAVFFNALNAVPIGLIQRESKFIKLALSDLTAELVALLTLYLLVTNGEGVTIYLAVRFAILGFVKFTLNMAWSAGTEFGMPRPGRNLFAISSISEMVRYQFLFNFVNFFSRNADNLAIGRYIGMTQLGIYEKAYALMRYPLQLLTFAITPAMQPVIARNRDDLTAVESAHSAFVRVLFNLATVVAIGLHSIADEFILLLLGAQWEAVAEILTIFCYLIPIQVVLSSSGAFYLGLDRPSTMFKTGLFAAASNLTAIVLGTLSGSMEMIAWFLVVSFHLNALQCYWVMYGEVFGVPLTRLFRQLLPGALLATIYLCVHPLYVQEFPLFSGASTFATFLLKGSTTALIACMVLLALGELRPALELLRRDR